MVNDKMRKVDEYVAILKAAMKYASEAQDQLPLFVTGALREQFLDLVTRTYMMVNLPKLREHEARKCVQCLNFAHNWATYALGWDDRHTARPSTATERSAMLKEQLEEVLNILDSYGDHEG